MTTSRRQRKRQQQLADLDDRVDRWTGRRASVLDLSRSDAVHALAEREPHLVEADRGGSMRAGIVT
jgi:hypothetical protein